VIKEVMQVIFERERLIKKSFDNQQILQKFLSEGFSEEEYIEFLHEHDLSPDSLCSCLLLEFSENMGRRESNFLIWEVIENTRPDWSKFYVAEGEGDFKIIFVMEDERDFSKAKNKIPPLILSFQNQGNGCLAGLSGLHCLAGGLKESCREARFSLKAAKRLRNSKTGFASFDDFSHLYFLFTHPNKKEIVKTSLEVLEPLLKYDAKNNSSLMNTLKVFLLSDCNQKRTAERLHLHRNSLRYRLEKIEEILGNDTFSGLKLQKLFLATSIYEIWKDDDPGTQESGRSTLS
jgi:sugar diacid utilization regulator